MRIGSVNGRGVGMETPDDLHEGGDAGQLLLVLKELVERLSGANKAGGAPRHDALERWEDEGYLYLEASLPTALEVDLDVNIQAGRAFLRMAR